MEHTPGSTEELIVRRTDEEVAAMIGPAALACSADLCAENEPGILELEPDDEALFGRLSDAVEHWSAHIESAKGSVRQVLDHVTQAEGNVHTIIGAGRERRRSDATDISSHTTNTLAGMRQVAKREVMKIFNGLCTANSVDAYLLTADEAEINEYRRRLDDSISGIMAGHGLYITLPGRRQLVLNPYESLFMSELVARSELALGIRQKPEMMREVLAPGSLSGLPEPMQQFLATDIVRGARGSLMLKLFSEVVSRGSDADPVPSDLLSSYLRYNGHTEMARGMLQMLAIGACAMGAPRCPVSPYGLCAELAGTIDPATLPAELVTEMQRKRQQRSNTIRTELDSWGKANVTRTSRWWRFAEDVAHINPQDRAIPARKKKAHTGRKQQPESASSVADSLSPAAEQVSGLPPHVRLSYKGSDEPVIIETADEDMKAAAVQQILKTKQFAAYMKRFEDDDGLPDLLEKALYIILFTPIYREQRATEPMTYIPNKDDRGRNATVWRLNMGALPGEGMTKNAKETRIYYVPTGSSDCREVKLISIKHKADVVKATNRGRIPV